MSLFANTPDVHMINVKFWSLSPTKVISNTQKRQDVILFCSLPGLEGWAGYMRHTWGQKPCNGKKIINLVFNSTKSKSCFQTYNTHSYPIFGCCLKCKQKQNAIQISQTYILLTIEQKTYQWLKLRKSTTLREKNWLIFHLLAATHLKKLRTRPCLSLCTNNRWDGRNK